LESAAARFRTNRIAAFAASGVAVLAGLYLLYFRPGEPLERWSFDLPHRFVPEVTIPAFKIVMMDEQSHQELRQQPGQIWDRSLHAELIEQLTTDGARLVVFDVYFQEPSPPHQAEADQAFIRAVEKSGKVVVAGVRAKSNHPNFAGGQTFRPAEVFRAAIGTNWGAPSILPDPDGRVRTHFRELPDDPSLPWVAARLAGAPVTQFEAERSRPRWLRFYGRSGSLPWLGYNHARNTSPGYFRDTIVFIGSDIEVKPQGSTADVYPVPTGGSAPGVEIAATAFLNLLRGDWIRRASSATETSLIVLGGLGFGVAMAMLRPLPGLAVAVFAMLAVAGASIGLFWGAGVWLNWTVLAAVQIPMAWGTAALLYGRRLARQIEETQVLTLSGQAEQSRVPTTETAPTDKLLIPDFTLIKRIGEGAYGEVWLAESLAGIYRAIKVVYRVRFSTERPFEREFEGLLNFAPASLNEPGWVSILHVGQGPHDEYFYYVMEAADDLRAGEEIDPEHYTPKTIGHMLDKRSSLPVDECLTIGVAIADALQALHERDLVHRDIKPSNIIFIGGRPKLADIGLVTLMGEATSQVGTPGFIPKEGTGLPPADIYALGKVLYQAATGIDARLYPGLPTASNPEGHPQLLLRLMEVVDKACAMEPGDRYASAARMAKALRGIQQSL